jgi:predicted transcriptional regulator
MTLVELKKSLHEKIDQLDDPDFLDIMNMMITNKDEVFQIPKEHLTDIEQGEADIKNGDFLTLEELEKRYEKWLKD